MKRQIVLALVAGIVLLSGCEKDPVLVTGEQVYGKYCVTCHQADGEGIPDAFPTLHETEWANGDKGRLIRLVLRGMQGPIEVKGESFSNVMTPHDFLTDEQIASVLTYVRQNFGNDAEGISVDEVQRVRSGMTGEGLYMASELKFRIGIPEAEPMGEDETGAEE